MFDGSSPDRPMRIAALAGVAALAASSLACPREVPDPADAGSPVAGNKLLQARDEAQAWRSNAPLDATALLKLLTDGGSGDADAAEDAATGGLDVEAYRVSDAQVRREDFGWLTVITEPRTVSILLGDPGFEPKEIGVTPIKDHRLVPGNYEISVDTKCYYPTRDTFRIERGEEKRFEVPLTPRKGTLKVTALSAAGKRVKADVFVDGTKVGRSPGSFEVPICSGVLRVEHPRLGRAEQEITIKEKGVTRARLKLKKVKKVKEVGAVEAVEAD